jgi:c-di-GMP-related signal transduction protein
LLNTALIRAKIAEILAEPVDCEPENAFILGLFSSVDAFFN